ncbi:hypothetical protein CYJ27_03120 [Aerococcus christensenii]|uniref:Putative small multi-drug export protein n=1 Tax=Aerococcus christensenii TaxID=87541 RepID=A0A0X8F8N7_9LACT|nr:small multi-drug export protein [Aerococcus christensenii]AMB92821.1 hypothetical protein AWM71_05805 [Aerococcus christensenii]KXB34467.1 putative small multi-drug export protein [Aerococcus christensenii]MDK8234044.1 small multi-drug export protein [Aerococcus christensenii]PKY91680.1 hypothetical protein CYJ27_03120 [Aerococcus christensenii]WEB71423.1 small multi-drug export protein [Aerococcus christensenii]
MIQLIVTFFQHYFTAPLIIFILSLFPLLELRGGLIAASLLGVPWQQAAVLTVIANMIPIPFIILLVERVLDHCALKGPFQFLAKKMIKKGRAQGTALLKKYPHSVRLGLFLFVAIPLPGTGAWTGAMIAAFLGLPPKKALLPIAFGVISACFIMLGLAYALPTVFGLK